MQIRHVAGAEKRPLAARLDAFHEQVRNPVGSVHVGRTPAFVASVFAQIHEVLDVQVPRLEVGAHRALAFAALVHCHRRVVGNFEERDYALAFTVRAFDVRTGGADICPVVTKTAGPFGQARVVGDQLKDAVKIIIHRAQVTGGKLRMQRARVEERGRGGHKAERTQRVIKLNRAFFAVSFVHRQPHRDAHIKILRRLNPRAADVDEVTIVNRLDAHVGKLLIAFEDKGVGQFGEVVLQQIRRQPVGVHALPEVIRKMIAMQLRQLHRRIELRQHLLVNLI